MLNKILTAETTNLQAGLDLSSKIFRAFYDTQWNDDPENRGIYCPGYSVEEEQAIDILQAEAEAMGGKAYVGLEGNVHFYFKGSNPDLKLDMISSHIDAVPKGGQFDGRAGVVAGLAAVKNKLASEDGLEKGVVVTVLRAEESAWWDSGVFGIGAKFLAGELTSSFLDKAIFKKDGQSTGVSLREKMKEIRMDVDGLTEALDSGKVLFPKEIIERNIEGHIEQADVLLYEGFDLGIVEAIRTYARFPNRIHFYGESAHSGAQRQDARQDAGFAVGEFVSLWRKTMKKLSSEPDTDLVYTMPDVHVEDPAGTTVPEHAYAEPEARSVSVETLKEVARITGEVARQAAEETGCTTDFDEKTVNIGQPAVMNPAGCDEIESDCKTLGIKAMRMSSGAGHDAGTMSNWGVLTNLLFWPTGNKGISHSPDEMLARDGEDPFAVGSSYATAVKYLTDGFLAKSSGQDMPSEYGSVEEAFERHGIKRREMFVRP